MGRRIRVLGIVMLLCFALVIVQLINIQFRRASTLANSPYNPRVAVKRFDNMRGTIYASDGQVLARSVKATSGAYHYMRQYPEPDASVFADVTGYDSIFYGTSGIEYQYNQYLQAHPQAPQDLSQLLFNKPPSTPDDVTLTIDPTLQEAAMNALLEAPLANRDGAIVVLNPTTGAVLAMASNPTYDPNGVSVPDIAADQAAYVKASAKDVEGWNAIRPLAYEERFFPGSTFKVITSTAVYNLDPSLIDFSFTPAASVTFPDSGGKALTNDGGSKCGGTMTLMLPQSCDPGYGALGVKVGVPTLTKQAEDFGYAVFGSSNEYVPNLDLPGVIPSVFSSLQPDAQALLAYSAIGQDNDQATPLEGALVAAGIANHGNIMTPHLMERITDSQGNTVDTYKPSVMLHAASASAAASVGKLMLSVANDTVPDATANGIFPISWHVAVKTGTAQDPRSPTLEQTDDWLIGFMPAVGTPEVAFAVTVPYQPFNGTGASNAAPIIKKVLQAYLTETGQQS
jgi:peptidoglycan glycosyltransferase